MNVHHARLIVTADATTSPVLESIDYASPDVYVISDSPLTIGRVRELQATASRRPVKDEVCLFVVKTASILAEAQHALLKLLEEPAETSRFLFVMPTAQGLLPTVLSRFEVSEEVLAPSSNEHFLAFQALAHGERLSYVADLVKQKEVAIIDNILAGAAHYVEGAGNQVLLTAVETALLYGRQRGASLKMLLESVALALPAGKQ